MDATTKRSLEIAQESNLKVLEAGAILSRVLEFLETIQESEKKEILVKRINKFLEKKIRH